mmetsp:Transcript_11327/g.22391  ORF Transcript_11327/g.22391 Transcript_11327/m.22391 type:complete len:85 (-) Transcript_11327:1810-2064(-)
MSLFQLNFIMVTNRRQISADLSILGSMIGNLALTPFETFKLSILLSAKPIGEQSVLDKMIGEGESFATDIMTATSLLQTCIPGS